MQYLLASFWSSAVWKFLKICCMNYEETDLMCTDICRTLACVVCLLTFCDFCCLRSAFCCVLLSLHTFVYTYFNSVIFFPYESQNLMQKHLCETFAEMVAAVYRLYTVACPVLDNLVWIQTVLCDWVAYIEVVELKILNRHGYVPAVYVIYEK